MTKKPLLFLLLSVIILVLDQVTKQAVKASLSPFDVIRVLPFLNIVYVENTGSAFGLFKSLGNAFFVVLSVGAAALLLFLLFRDRENRLAYSLVLGGAAGNLTDRVMYGYVIDFVDVFVSSLHWPAFNVADSALTAGIGLMFVSVLLPARKGGAQRAGGDGPSS